MIVSPLHCRFLCRPAAGMERMGLRRQMFLRFYPTKSALQGVCITLEQGIHHIFINPLIKQRKISDIFS
jgi:hypothetical protein